MIFHALRLMSHLKQRLGKLYLLLGKEALLLEDTKQLLIDTYAKQIDPLKPLEYTTLWLESASDWEKLYAHTQYDAMFPTTLIIKGKYAKSTLDQASKSLLIQTMQAPTTDLLILIEAPNLTLKTLQPMFQHVPDAHLIEIPLLKDQAYIQFIEKHLQQAHLTYQPGVPAFIAGLTQGNPLEAVQCIHQLSLLMDTSKPIALSLLSQLLQDVALFPLYTFCDTCIQGNTATMLRQLLRLKQLETEPLLLLWWITKMTRQLLHMHHGMAHQENIEEICKQLGIWSAQKQTYLNACKRLSPSLLKSILARCKQLDTLLKSAPPSNIWDQFEQLALSLCEPLFILSPERVAYG